MWIRRNRDDRGNQAQTEPSGGVRRRAALKPRTRIKDWAARGVAGQGAPIGEPDVVRRLPKSHDAGRHRPCDRRAGMLIEQTPAATIETARSHCARYFGTAWQLSRADAAGIGVVWPNLAIMGALGGAFLAAAVSRFRAMLARQT